MPERMLERRAVNLISLASEVNVPSKGRRMEYKYKLRSEFALCLIFLLAGH